MHHPLILTHESVELAELFGILFGDGHVKAYPGHNYHISISGNSLNDKAYHEGKIRDLFHHLFSVTPKVYYKKNQNTLVTQIGSKLIFDFLISKGMCNGRKDNLVIPDWIRSSEIFFIAFIRGLFDTDGCITLRTRGQHTIKIALKNENIILEVNAFLASMGFFTCCSRTIRNDNR
jgi:intein/homing endonuclease